MSKQWVRSLLCGMSVMERAPSIFVLFCFALLFQSDSYEGSSLKNVRQRDSLVGCHVPAGTRAQGFGKETGRRSVIIGRTLW